MEYEDEIMESEMDLDEADYNYSIDEADIDLSLVSGSLLEDSQILDGLDEDDLDSSPKKVKRSKLKVSVGHDESKYKVTGESVDMRPKVRLKDIGECLLLYHKESDLAPSGFMRYIESLECKEFSESPEKDSTENLMSLYLYLVPAGVSIFDKLDESITVRRIVSKVYSPESLNLVVSRLGVSYIAAKVEEMEQLGKKEKVDIEPPIILRHYVDKTIKKYHQFKLDIDYRY